MNCKITTGCRLSVLNSMAISPTHRSEVTLTTCDLCFLLEAYRSCWDCSLLQTDLTGCCGYQLCKGLLLSPLHVHAVCWWLGLRGSPDSLMYQSQVGDSVLGACVRLLLPLDFNNTGCCWLVDSWKLLSPVNNYFILLTIMYIIFISFLIYGYDTTKSWVLYNGKHTIH